MPTRPLSDRMAAAWYRQLGRRGADPDRARRKAAFVDLCARLQHYVLLLETCPPFGENLIQWWAARQETGYDDNDPILTLVDLIDTANNFTTPGGLPGVYETAGFNAGPSVDFDNLAHFTHGNHDAIFATATPQVTLAWAAQHTSISGSNHALWAVHSTSAQTGQTNSLRFETQSNAWALQEFLQPTTPDTPVQGGTADTNTHVFVLVWDGGDFQLYVDLELVLNTGITMQQLPSVTSFELGCHTGGSFDVECKGRCAEFAVWDFAADATEAATIASWLGTNNQCSFGD